jgi:hypothetical protein
VADVALSGRWFPLAKKIGNPAERAAFMSRTAFSTIGFFRALVDESAA